MTQNAFFVEWLNNNELQVFILIRSLNFLFNVCAKIAQVLSLFQLCSLKDDTFEKLIVIKSNNFFQKGHHSKSVNNLKIADHLCKILKYQTISI